MAAKYVEQLSGWDITWQRMYGGGHAIRMLDEGQVCMSLVGSSPIAAAQLRGSKIELIGMVDIIGDAEQLVVKKHIESPMDLEGKILVTVTDSTAQFHLLLIEKLFGVNFGKVLDINNLVDMDENAITFQEAWDSNLVDGIYMWGASQAYAADNGGHKLIGSAELGNWEKPNFDGFASRTDVSSLDSVFTATLVGVMATLVGVMATLNKAYVSKTPREWVFDSSEMQASLATTGVITEAAYESYMESMNGLIFNDLDEQRSCDHIGCGLQGINAQALKAVNTFKMGIKAATSMRSDELWENSTNANYLDLAASQGYGVIANIDDWDQSARDNIIANYSTMNHHGHAWHGTTPHDNQCSGTVTISSDGTFSDGHLTGLSYHDNADCTWILDSATASDTTTVSVSFLDIAGGWDTLTISDSSGDILAVFSGLQTPPPISAVGPVTVRFETDGRPQIFATDKEAGFIASVAFTSTPPTTCSEGKYGADCSSDYCYGKTTLSTSGTITTQHRNLAICSWELTASDGKVVLLDFSAMALEYLNDFVEVFDSDGTILGKFSGFSPPPKLVSSGSTMKLRLTTDDLVWQDQGFTASFTSVDSPDLATCEPGKFGPYCDFNFCFGSMAIEANPNDKEGIILSGNNFPGGLNCNWVLGKDAASSYDSIIFSFNEIDMEPDPQLEGIVPDQLVFMDGASDSVLYTVRGKSSQCSRSVDCHPNSNSESPSACVFSDETDVFGVCVCEEGFANGDCSESVITLTPTEGFVTVSHETDINDPYIFNGWNMTYSFCGGMEYGSCEEKYENPYTVTAQWIGLIGKIALIVFASTFLVVYLRAACGGLPHIAKMHVYYHIQLAYSVFDWFLDMESSANMYKSGSALSGLNALMIMVVNAVVSIFFILRVYKFEKTKGNFDFDLFKKETIMMAFVQFAALTNIKIMMYGPWITTLYRGHSSRYAYTVFNIVPLLTENIPQFLNQAYYLSARADRDTLTLKNVTVISTIMSALAIIGTGLKAMSTIFMEDDQKMGIDKLFDRENNGIERDISKEAFAEHLADQHSSAKQLVKLSLNSTKVTPVDGDPPTREEIKELEEGLKVKGNDVMVFKKNVLQELLNDVLKKTREREREQERERLKEATAGMAKQNP
eukprot:CAMPEP_0118670636 /NCGR_PEP_ID=MMETSP0785-20121206/21572_1 /TAXON_ID=91992 /ORGANISM="Bolidomonas pacifica, Strain CCMP 1866" /LENGTH=1131 /DNA_ID=CAMNT_0006565463 /DNA_START=279 /DNA_END=3670 /DNA_ORIENTATION=+